MHPNEIHHIKVYIVFFVLSMASIGLLIYLYLPTNMAKDIQSSVLKKLSESSAEVPEINVPNSSTSNVENALPDIVAGRRMRLTQILIRSQKELQTLEDQRKNSPQGLDPLVEQKIIKLSEKIASIEKMITEM